MYQCILSLGNLFGGGLYKVKSQGWEVGTNNCLKMRGFGGIIIHIEPVFKPDFQT